MASKLGEFIDWMTKLMRFTSEHKPIPAHELDEGLVL